VLSVRKCGKGVLCAGPFDRQSRVTMVGDFAQRVSRSTLHLQ
jgi:hypothetical protein